MADSGTEIVAPMKNSVVNLMMNHIAYHLQFLALLTSRLSTEKLADGDIYTRTFSSYHSAARKALESGALGTTKSEPLREMKSLKYRLHPPKNRSYQGQPRTQHCHRMNESTWVSKVSTMKRNLLIRYVPFYKYLQLSFEC